MLSLRSAWRCTALAISTSSPSCRLASRLPTMRRFGQGRMLGRLTTSLSLSFQSTASRSSLSFALRSMSLTTKHSPSPSSVSTVLSSFTTALSSSPLSSSLSKLYGAKAWRITLSRAFTSSFRSLSSSSGTPKPTPSAPTSATSTSTSSTAAAAAAAAASQQQQQLKRKTSSTLLYIASTMVLLVGASYAAVPLYKLFCQTTGLGGTTSRTDDTEKIRTMEPVQDRVIRIKFCASTSSTMTWKFFPQQKEITVVPGETALAFFTASNPSDHAITGMSTYNVVPFESGQYFNKIQCFCFEEQRLNPHEEVDMPVLFYIDPEFAEDPLMSRVNEITLSYTFFKAKDMPNTNVKA